MKIKYLIVFSFFILMGCKQVLKEVRREQYNYRIDTVKIAVDENYLQNYTSVQNQILGNLLFAYNARLHTFDVFDLVTKTPCFSLSLEKEGPNGVIGVNAFYVTDSCFVIDDQHQYTVLSHDGKVNRRILKEKINSSAACSDYLATSFISITNYERLVFDEKRKELLVSLVPKISGDYKNKNCLATLHMETEDVSLLPAPFPAVLSKQSFGLLCKPSFLCKGDSIIYNFPMSSAIYIYNRNTGELIEKKVDSYFTSDLAEKYDGKKDMVEHFMKSAYFYEVKYDSYRNQYYRLHFDKLEDLRDSRKRDMYLIVMDPDFQKVEEYKLGENTYSNYNITPDGLHFEFMRPPSADEYSYMQFTSETIRKIYSVNDIQLLSPEAQKEEFTDMEFMEKTPDEHFFDMGVFNDASDHRGFIYKHLNYPEDEYKNGQEGVIYIVLQRDGEGTIVEYKVEERLCQGDFTDKMVEEALRIARMIERVNPDIEGEFMGFPVVFRIDVYNKRHGL